MATYNIAWQIKQGYENNITAFYVTRELATKRALSSLMSDCEDFDEDHYKLEVIGDTMQYWVHTKTGFVYWIERIRIFTGE